MDFFQIFFGNPGEPVNMKNLKDSNFMKEDSKNVNWKILLLVKIPFLMRFFLVPKDLLSYIFMYLDIPDY